MSLKIICDLCEREFKSDYARRCLSISRFSGQQRGIFPLFEDTIKRDICDNCFDKIFGK